MKVKIVSSVMLRMAMLMHKARSASRRTVLRLDDKPMHASTMPSVAEKSPACSPMRTISRGTVRHHKMNDTANPTAPLASESSAQCMPMTVDRDGRTVGCDFMR